VETRNNINEAFENEPYQWLSAARWYLWEGGFLVIARARGFVGSHAHHAIQIVIALDGKLAIAGKQGDWRECAGMIIQPDVVHLFNCNGALGAMLFVDPESSEGRWMRTSLNREITIVPDTRLISSIAELRKFTEQPFESMEIGELIRHCVNALSPGPSPKRQLDARVTTVLNAIRASNDLHISLADAANKAFLSPSRFAHLFKQQLGLPFSRYMLWRKMTRAMVAIGSGQTIADAAHAADFADSAHLTRTFYQMVGMAPSALMRGEFAEIPSPFNMVGSGVRAAGFASLTE
jgi:AraC-like DNA-binding protein